MRISHTALLAALMLAGGSALAVQVEAETSIPATAQITGALAYRERIALPPDAVAEIRLEDVSLADAPVRLLSHQEIALKGRQVPIAFSLDLPTQGLTAGRRYGIRGGIRDGDGRLIWTTDSFHGVDPASPAPDLGTLALVRVTAEPARPVSATPSIPFQCGGRGFITRFDEDGMELTLDGKPHRLAHAVSASGARYTGQIDGKPVEFWNKGREATLTLDGQRWPLCREKEATTGPYVARGNEPGWRLRLGFGQLHLEQQEAATITIPLPAPQTTGTGQLYSGRAGQGEIAVTIEPGLCQDSMTGRAFPDRVAISLPDRRLQGCGGDPASLLQGGDWRVVELAGEPLAAQPAVTLRFDGNRVAGRAGCNAYTGNYRLTGEGLTVEGNVAATMMACLPAAMAVEQRFLALLRTVNRYHLQPDGTLALIGADNARILARRAAE